MRKIKLSKELQKQATKRRATRATSEVVAILKIVAIVLLFEFVVVFGAAGFVKLSILFFNLF